MINLFFKNRQSIALIAAVFMYLNFLVPVLATVADIQSKPIVNESYDPYMRAAKFYLPSLAKKELAEIELAAKIKKENDKMAREFSQSTIKFGKSTVGKISGLGEVEMFRLICSLFANPQKYSQPKQVFIDDSMFAGMELLCGKSKDSADKNWFSSIDRTITPFGRVALQSIFTRGFDSVEEQTKKAKKIQTIVKYLSKNGDLSDNLESCLKSISEKASDLMFLFKPIDEASQNAINQFFITSGMLPESFTTLCNENRYAHKFFVNDKWKTGITFISLLTILLLVIKYPSKAKDLMVGLGNSIKGISMPSLDGLAVCADKLAKIPGILVGAAYKYPQVACLLIVYGALLAFTYYLSRKSNEATNKAIENAKLLIEEKIKNIAVLTSSIYKLEALCKDDVILGTKFKLLENSLSADQIAERELLNELMSLYASTKADGKPIEDDMFSTKLSHMLTTFKRSLRLPNTFIKSLKRIGKLDAYLSLAKLYKEHSTENAKYCFVDFVESSKPYINIQDYWFPMIDSKIVVTNSIELGSIVTPSQKGDTVVQANNGQCAIISGPNAGGKTINLKGIMSAVIMATRTGLAPALSMKLTQFARIDSHMEVGDAVGSMSRFESEKSSAIQFLNGIKQLKPGEFQLELMDEIFSSTNPEEGQSLAYAIANSIVNNPNCMCFIASHFKKLTELETATHGHYRNYKVFVDIKPDGTLSRPYKLVPGISDQNVAILMCKDTFGSEITDTAYQILSQVKSDTSDILGYKCPVLAN